MTERPARPAITCVNDSESERQTRDLLLDLMDRYPLERWLYTDAVQIQDGVIPHSHPVLTIAGGHTPDHPLRLLSSYIHEQLHWFWLLEAHGERRPQAIDRLYETFPGLPVALPAGCRTEFSTYLHVAINFWELRALESLIGPEPAHAFLSGKPYYTAVYALVLRETGHIQSILADLDLMPPDLPPVDKRFVTADR